MIEKIDLPLPNAVGFKVKGKVDDVAFKRSTRELMKQFENEHCNLYLEVESIKGITFEAVWDSLKLGLSHLREFVKNINKIAVVTDIKWIQMATKVENKLIPAIEEKVFKPEEKEMAKVWLTD